MVTAVVSSTLFLTGYLIYHAHVGEKSTHFTRRVGEATVEVPLNDSLTSFRIVAVASSGAGLFGTGEASKIFLIGYGCFWVMLSNVIAAVKLVDPLLLRAARMMDTNRLDLLTRVALPATERHP